MTHAPLVILRERSDHRGDRPVAPTTNNHAPNKGIETIPPQQRLVATNRCQLPITTLRTTVPGPRSSAPVIRPPSPVE